MSSITLRDKGLEVIEGYLDARGCQEVISAVELFQQNHHLNEIIRPIKPRPLRYKVIDGLQIQKYFKNLWELYVGDMLALAREKSGLDLSPLANEQAGININIMAPHQSSYRWHYDRNEVTAILYLNTVKGGETELFPNYRIMLGKGTGWLQMQLDRIIQLPVLRNNFSEKIVIKPETGKLVFMKGNRCWHSVRPLEGNRDRINIIFAFHSKGSQEQRSGELDNYLYTTGETKAEDPNYSN